MKVLLALIVGAGLAWAYMAGHLEPMLRQVHLQESAGGQALQPAPSKAAAQQETLALPSGTMERGTLRRWINGIWLSARNARQQRPEIAVVGDEAISLLIELNGGGDVRDITERARKLNNVLVGFGERVELASFE